MMADRRVSTRDTHLVGTPAFIVGQCQRPPTAGADFILDNDSQTALADHWQPTTRHSSRC
jgi:hypothetical protein